MPARTAKGVGGLGEVGEGKGGGFAGDGVWAVPREKEEVGEGADGG